MGSRRPRSLRRPVLAGGGLVLFGLLVTGWETCAFQGCPDVSILTAYRTGEAPVLLDRSGVRLAELHPLQRSIVPLDSLSDFVPAAFLAVEDRRFHRHRGVDWWRVLGATWSNLRAGERLEGASTLTMQLARTVFPDRIPRVQRTFGRKLLEIRTAREIERRFEKREILELYLNHIYVGGNAYGVEAGARLYFARSATELTLDQAALLAAVVRAPAHYDPRVAPNRALERRDLVLGLLQDQGHIGADDVEEARGRALSVVSEASRPELHGRAPYFVALVQEMLERELGAELYRAPLRIHTTLDARMQLAAEEELLHQIEAVEAGRFGPFVALESEPAGGRQVVGSASLEGAVVVLDAGSGNILALVGGRDFGTSRYNRATRARRPMGSAFKPFVFAAALEHGYVASQPIADRPLTLRQEGSTPWSPRNFDDDFVGPVSMRRALVESRNVPTVRLALAVGMDAVVRTAVRAGIPEPLPGTPAVALGTSLASPLELAVAYAGFAGPGTLPAPRSVTRIEDSRGDVVRAFAAAPREGMDPRIAYILDDILEEAVARGTGHGVRMAGFTGPAAGKTGTSQGAHDVWFAGRSGELVGVVWMGFDRPHPILPGASGGTLAAPVWGRIMARIQEFQPSPAGREMPAGIVIRPVDAERGTVLDPQCRTRPDVEVRALFLEEFVPATGCPTTTGFFSRIVGFFRSRSEPEQRTESVRLGDSPERFLGSDRVPLASGF